MNYKFGLILILTICFILYTKKRIEGFGTSIKVDKVLVINLDKDSKRYKSIKNQCKKANVKFTKFSAIDGQKLSINKLKQSNVLNLTKYSFFNHNKDGRNSLKGSIGCALTHRQIWKQISKSNKSTLILEDDIVLPKNFWTKLNTYTSQIPNDWDIIFIGGVRIYGTNISKNIIKAKTTNNNGWNNCGLYAYILNPVSAKKLLHVINPINNYLDIQMNRHYNYLNVYYILPTLVKHNFKIPSTRNTGKGTGYIYDEKFRTMAKEIIVI
jgi:glycosyl transferase family 25